MNRYLLDTNHLTALIDRQPQVVERVEVQLIRGQRIGVCLPVLCEYRAGIRIGKRFKRNLARLEAARSFLRFWPADQETALEFSKIFQELRAIGREMSPFDLLIAAIARQRHLVVLTADADFQPVARLKTENWL